METRAGFWIASALIFGLHGFCHAGDLPGRYFKLMDVELAAIEKRLAAEPKIDLKTLEAKPEQRHFPGAILAAAVLYTREHPDNPHFGDKKKLALALLIGDLLATEHEKETFQQRGDHDWDLYMWLESQRLLDKDLGVDRRARWKKEMTRDVEELAEQARARLDFPRYQGGFIRTSTNHLALWAVNIYLAGRMFQNKEWEELGTRILHRLAAEEQTADGYWGEFTDNGPTTGYNYLTLSAVALYYEHSRDTVALEALRRATDFHKHFTWPDGTPVEVINGRNRHWRVSAWGHFGFSHFPDGRRYAEFLTRFFEEGKVNYHALGRLAQNALYYHEGPTAAIPQNLPRSAHQMKVPAGIRKTGPWVVCLSGLTDPPTESQFTLDRQGHLSIFHEKLGLIVSGANSKRQPELATFLEKQKDQVKYMPSNTRLRMSDARDRLGLAYSTFFAELTVQPPEKNEVPFSFVITETGRNRLQEAQLNLQLCLRAGDVLETAKSKTTLGEGKVELSALDVGGVVRHRGWILKVPAAARLTWPVFPFNPYRNAPETDLQHAVGVLMVPVEVKPPKEGAFNWRTQELGFVLGEGAK